MSMMRRRSKSRTRSAQSVRPYIGSTPFDHSPQPFIPPPLAPSTAPHSPLESSPPASSVGLPLGASSTTPPPEDPFGLGQGIAGLSLGGPRSAAHYSAAGYHLFGVVFNSGSRALDPHRGPPGFALTIPPGHGHYPAPPSSAPALGPRAAGYPGGYFPPGMGLSRKTSERGVMAPHQMYPYAAHNSYGYQPANGAGPVAPPPPMGYPPYGPTPYNPYGYPGMPGGGYPGVPGAGGYPAPYFPPPQIMPPPGAMAHPGPASAISENMPLVVRGARLVRPKEDEQPAMKWEPGKDYAPVLDPFTLGILNPKMEIHPLLRPSDGGEHLVYNMLFPPSAIHLSTDPPTKSWSSGRFSMATFPRVKRIRIVCRSHPWLMEVTNDSGVTVGDVCDRLYTEHQRHMSSAEWEMAVPTLKRQMTKAYQWNRSTNPGAPGGVMGEGLRRVDWLMQTTHFAGLTEDRAVIEERVGHGLQRAQPATFVLEVNSGPKKDEED
ncbi:hypothetical protein RhiJN_28884 [Ceratobasidium sp. AG-Ba]|nr:hypothetical protein RhiJN_28884 [Ceratobasidium sp. AG-Ba]